MAGFTNIIGQAIDGGGVVQTNLNLNSKNLTNGGDISGANANAYKLVNAAASTTVPTVLTDRAQTNSGFGGSGGTVYHIEGGAASMLVGTGEVRSLIDITQLSTSGSAFVKLKNLVTLTGAFSGATFDVANAIPAGAIVVGTSFRVTTAITGATTWSVGPTTDTTRYGTGIAVALGTTADTTAWASTTTAIVYPTATTLRFTAAGGAANFSAGVVRIVINYFLTTAPTS